MEPAAEVRMFAYTGGKERCVYVPRESESAVLFAESVGGGAGETRGEAKILGVDEVGAGREAR